MKEIPSSDHYENEYNNNFYGTLAVYSVAQIVENYTVNGGKSDLQRAELLSLQSETKRLPEENKELSLQEVYSLIMNAINFGEDADHILDSLTDEQATQIIEMINRKHSVTKGLLEDVNDIFKHNETIQTTPTKNLFDEF